MMITAEHMAEYMMFAEQKGWSSNTLQTYLRYARRWIGLELNQKNVNMSVSHCPNNYRPFLKGFLECFNLDRDIKIIRRMGRVEKKNIVYYTKAEIDAILSQIRDERLLLMMRLMFEIGLRISEVMALRKRDFDMINHRVKGKGKGNKWFDLPIFTKTYDMLESYLDKFELDEHVFYWDDIKQDPTNQRKKALYWVKKHVIEILPHKQEHEVCNHAFRHACGTYLREKGFDLKEIQMILRHERLETTGIYTTVDRKKLDRKHQEMMERSTIEFVRGEW